ncbi:5-oxoprolinase subunit PxpB [Pseudoxanthomonas sp. UTMC 1351]|uniref:5-oxoprolinase subunit PxpB n=1 Tax=Pseudoxanthomonas sp. UTMC 1351 TaxID=2695853 RepID=UPI0034CF20EF
MTPLFEPLSDDALLLRLGDSIDATLNAQAHTIASKLREQAPPWLRDLVPAYASLAVFFDARHIEHADPHAYVISALKALLGTPLVAALREPDPINIPVCYGEEFGPDVAEAARLCGISVDDLITRHTAATYIVAMIGFAPGFPYLLGLDESLTLPRLATPRTRVPAGSVAIGGAQTGIYPRESPGGWRLLGRTPLVLFDAARETPSLLSPGDRVRFVPVGADVFADESR